MMLKPLHILAGVSMQENRRYLSALRKLLERPENRICADCKDNSAGSRPSWASINTGVFICMRCAGVHRGLGVHISKVHCGFPCGCQQMIENWSQNDIHVHEHVYTQCFELFGHPLFTVSPCFPARYSHEQYSGQYSVCAGEVMHLGYMAPWSGGIHGTYRQCCC